MIPFRREKTSELVQALEDLVDEFDKQGATAQATQLDGLLDDWQAELEHEKQQREQMQ